MNRETDDRCDSAQMNINETFGNRNVWSVMLFAINGLSFYSSRQNSNFEMFIFFFLVFIFLGVFIFFPYSLEAHKSVFFIPWQIIFVNFSIHLSNSLCTRSHIKEFWYLLSSASCSARLKLWKKNLRKLFWNILPIRLGFTA